jgi:hypothetical protein
VAVHADHREYKVLVGAGKDSVTTTLCGANLVDKSRPGVDGSMSARGVDRLEVKREKFVSINHCDQSPRLFPPASAGFAE